MVRFAVVIMARNLYGQFGSASMAFARDCPSEESVESGISVTQ
jgi:hypothetical protein